MKKLLLILGVGLLVLVAGLYVAGMFFLGGIVKAGVNNFGPKLTQTRVELAGATLSPLSGTGTLTGLAVGNPAGWSEGNAFYLGKVHVDVAPGSLFGDAIVINEIVIDRPEFTYETRIFSSNIKDLLKNIQKYTGGAEGKNGGGSGSSRKFVLKKFRMTNAKATLGVGPTALAVPLPPLSISHLGEAEGGITADQLAGVLMKDVLANIVQGTATALTQTGGTAGATGLEATKEAARKAGESLKKLFGK